MNQCTITIDQDEEKSRVIAYYGRNKQDEPILQWFDVESGQVETVSRLLKKGYEQKQK